MNENVAEFFQKMNRNIDRVAVIVFLVLLVAAGAFFLQERNYRAAEPPERAPKQFNVKIPRPSDLPAEQASDFEKVQGNMGSLQTDINEDADMRRLVAINMFDIKSVRSETERAKEIQKDFDRAQQLFEQKNYEEAQRVVETILRRNPNHSRTLRLKDKIDQALAPAPAAEATATPVAEEGTEPGPMQ